MREYKLNQTKPMNDKFDSIKSALIKQLPQVRNVKDFITILQKVLETLGAKEDPAPAPQKQDPESRPAPKRDIVLEGILRDRRRANSSFAFSKDRPPRDSW
jgi:hypothetical protein